MSERSFEPNIGAQPDPDTYVGRYTREYEQREGRPIPPKRLMDITELEGEFGSEACIAAAEDRGWERLPNYLRAYLNDPKNQRGGTAPVVTAAGGRPIYVTMTEDFDQKLWRGEASAIREGFSPRGGPLMPGEQDRWEKIHGSAESWRIKSEAQP